jgi:hypothetical protein
VSEARIADAALALACAPDRRRRLAGAGPRLVDGRGAQQTTEAIVSAIEGGRQPGSRATFGQTPGPG